VPDIQHSAIPDGQRHEPKGISTASSGQVYVASGTGSGVWATPKSIVKFTPIITAASVPASTTSEQTFTVTGVLATDELVGVIKPTHQTTLGIVNSRIVANNQIAITYMHIGGGGPITPTSETYSVLVWR
jgi:hypothetical protein